MPIWKVYVNIGSKNSAGIQHHSEHLTEAVDPGLAIFKVTNSLEMLDLLRRNDVLIVTVEHISHETSDEGK